MRDFKQNGKGAIQHYRIKYNGKKYFIHGDAQFDSIRDMVKYYQGGYTHLNFFNVLYSNSYRDKIALHYAFVTYACIDQLK